MNLAMLRLLMLDVTSMVGKKGDGVEYVVVVEVEYMRSVVGNEG